MTWSRFKYSMLVKVRPRVGFNIAGWSKYDLEKVSIQQVGLNMTWSRFKYSRLVKIRPGVQQAGQNKTWSRFKNNSMVKIRPGIGLIMSNENNNFFKKLTFQHPPSSLFCPFFHLVQTYLFPFPYPYPCPCPVLGACHHT